MSLLSPSQSSNPPLRRDSSATNPIGSDSELHSLTTISSYSDEGELASPKTLGSVALIGMACRSSGANNSSQLWDNLLDQKVLQRKMPHDRYNVDAFYHLSGASQGTAGFPRFPQKL